MVLCFLAGFWQYPVLLRVILFLLPVLFPEATFPRWFLTQEMVSCFLPSHTNTLHMCMWCTCFRDQIHWFGSSRGILQSRLNTEFCWPLPDWPSLKVVQEERKACTAKSLKWEQGNAARWGSTCGAIAGLMGQSEHTQCSGKLKISQGKNVKEDNQFEKRRAVADRRVTE